ncbi:MAG TPA: alpha/beta hydrolase [Thermoguttaceae bacterium]|nr:alpha/beta hydrolase [Thermoguttaceae bacterium]
MTIRSILAQAFVLVYVFAATTLMAADPPELTLWPGTVPGETAEPGETTVKQGDDGILRVTYVGSPTITVYPAPKETANGCAVVVCPGGGYNILAWDLEGTEIAKWLNSIGVTGIVLKYRVPRRDKEQPHKAPLQDAQRAIRLARNNADAWAIDPQRIGILGFSAGGNLTVMAGTHWDETTYEKIDAADELSCRPDFMVPIYCAYLGAKDNPWALNSLVRVTEKTPPTFMAVTLDDSYRGAQAALLLVELKKAGVPAELHVYTKGGHGYGLRPSDNPVCTWPARCEQWMRSSGLLKSEKASQ